MEEQARRVVAVVEEQFGAALRQKEEELEVIDDRILQVLSRPSLGLLATMDWLEMRHDYYVCCPRKSPASSRG